MAERYKPKVDYVSQIAVQQPFGAQKVARAFEVAQREQEQANEVLFKGAESLGRAVEKVKTKKDIENFTVDFETIDKVDAQGNEYTIERPKPMKNKVFFFQENRQQYEKFAALKTKQEISRSLQQQAGDIKRRVQTEFGNNPQEFIAQMQPVLETIKEALPPKFYNLLEGDIDDIYAQNVTSIENSFAQEQQRAQNAEYEDYMDVTSNTIISHLNNNKLDTAKYLINEIEESGIDWKQTSSSARIGHNTNIQSLKDTVGFYEKYGSYLPGLSIADQTRNGQAINLHNLNSLKALIDGVGDVKLFSRKSNINTPDVTITLNQFNNDFALNSKSRTALRTAITRRISMLDTETSTDNLNDKLFRLADFVGGENQLKGNTSIEFVNLTSLLSSSKPEERQAAFAIFKANPKYGITEGNEFDANNVSHYSIPILHQFASGKLKTVIENKIFSKDIKFLNELLSFTVANQYGTTYNASHLDLSPTTERYLTYLSQIRVGRDLEEQDLHEITSFEALERDISDVKTSQKMTNIEDGVRDAVTNLFEGTFNRNEFQHIDPTIRDHIQNRIINNIHFLNLEKGAVTEEATRIAQNLKDKGIIGVSEFNTAGKTKGERATAFDDFLGGIRLAGKTKYEDLAWYPINRFYIVNPNTGEVDSKFIEAMMYKKFLESDQNAERDTPNPKYKKGFLFVTPVVQDGRAPIRDADKMEYTIKVIGPKGERELTKDGETIFLRPQIERAEVDKFDTSQGRTRRLIKNISEETRYQTEVNGEAGYKQILNDLDLVDDEEAYKKYFNEYTKDIP